MKKLMIICLVAMLVTSAQAGITVGGAADDSLSPPQDLRMGALESDTAIYVIAESENVTLSSDLSVNINADGIYDEDSDLTGGSIASGTDVNSYIVHFDKLGDSADLHSLSGSVTLDGNILGVIVLTAELDASDTPVGDGSSNYDNSTDNPTWHAYRGLELTAQDSVTVSGKTVSFTLKTGQTIDEIRIIEEVPSATVEKAVSSDEADLGDHMTVTLTVDNPYSSDIKVEDELPDDLKYIPGTFEVSGNPVTPTIDDNIISTMIGPGPNTIEFDVQLVEVPAEEDEITNWARIYNPGDIVDDSCSVDITRYPYDGFVKEVEIIYEDIEDDDVTVGELVQWNMTITLPNNFAWPITNAVLKDNLGGELGLAGDNTIPSGTMSFKTKGKTKKVQFKITGITVAASGELDFVIGIFTDKNPGGHQCYTSDGVHYLNSGATVKFIDPDPMGPGFQLSAHTESIEVDVLPAP